MPCADATERICLVLDEADRIRDYTLVKAACGVGVGPESLLRERLRGVAADEVLGIERDAFAQAFVPNDDTGQFLARKHIAALQAVLGVLTGTDPHGLPAKIAYQDGDLTITLSIPVNLDTEQIAPCSPCSGCGG